MLKNLWNRWFAEPDALETEPRDQDYEGRKEPPLPVKTSEEQPVSDVPPPLPPPFESV